MDRIKATDFALQPICPNYDMFFLFLPRVTANFHMPHQNSPKTGRQAANLTQCSNTVPLTELEYTVIGDKNLFLDTLKLAYLSNAA